MKMSNRHNYNFSLLRIVMIDNSVREFGNQTASCSRAEELVCNRELANT